MKLGIVGTFIILALIRWYEKQPRVKSDISRPDPRRFSRYREYHALADIGGPISSTLEVVGHPYEAGGKVGCLGVNHHRDFRTISSYVFRHFGGRRVFVPSK
jgi:hypothetical protein